jgi:hypothetical protein
MRPEYRPKMNLKQELWACACKLEEDHGAKAWSFACSRIRELESEGDDDAAAIWLAIRSCLVVLREARSTSSMESEQPSCLSSSLH